MDKLQAKSALYSDYNIGVQGAAGNQLISLFERRGLMMHNLVVWDIAQVNSLFGSALSLPDTGQSTHTESSSILWTGPDRYLIISKDYEVIDALSGMSDEHGALQEMSSARTVIRIQGEPCRSMMAKGLTVDLGSDAFQTGQIILSSFDHHYPAIIHNVDSDSNSFDIYVTRSFALSFWHWLCDSSLEFGYQVLEPESNG